MDNRDSQGFAGVEESSTEPSVVDADEHDTALPEVEALSYYGTDFDIHGLVRRLNQSDIVIPNFDPSPTDNLDLEGFQRKFVWKKTQMDRFVESLLLSFPVPGIFLVQQTDRKLLVLDGQQRLRTLQQFYSGELYSGVEFRLENVAKELQGLLYADLDDDLRRLLDNTFIHATIVKFNATEKGAESVYSLFERLNTGGTNLYPQEIRVALYSGPFVEFLRELNSNADWRAIYGPVNERLKDQEIILRFLAFYLDEEHYKRPLKGFLNDFLFRHREMGDFDREHLKDVFSSTCAAINTAFGRRAFRAENQINAALADAILIGVSSRLKSGPISDTPGMEAARSSLLGNSDFRNSIARATADEDRVSKRLSMGRAAFESIK
ncbi:DUF262 domain-containing protein [Frankia sp. Hr75.2]|nr:DUF262 domain-containing protein [Frankia sp. Hr75.2]